LPAGSDVLHEAVELDMPHDQPAVALAATEVVLPKTAVDAVAPIRASDCLEEIQLWGTPTVLHAR
jgi:hypothetical protein